MFRERERSASEEGDGFSAAFEPSLNGGNGGTVGGGAPLVKLNDICSDSMDTTESIPMGRGDGSVSEGIATVGGGPRPIPKTSVCRASGDDSSSLASSQRTVISRPPHSSASLHHQPFHPPQVPKISLGYRADSGESERQTSPESPLGICVDPHEANYLDVAVLRCLLIRNWAEEGTFWAVQYLLNRLIAMRQHRAAHEGAFRSRYNSDSAAIPTRKTSKNEAANFDTKGYLTWAELQEHNGAAIFSPKRSDKVQLEDNQEQRVDEAVTGRNVRGVAFEREEDEGQLQRRSKKRTNRRRRISLSAIPSGKMSPGATLERVSRPSICSPRRMERATSVPASFPRLAELLQGFFASSCDSPAMQQQQQQRRREQNVPEKKSSKRKSSYFFPEAIGASSFIESNGHLSLAVVLKVLSTLMERCCIVRVSEIVLNCCDTLLNMPGTDQRELFSKLLHIIHRICLQLGCPNGCNEGVHTPQAEFLRVKVRNLIAQMHRTNPRALCMLLRDQVAQTPCVQLVDALHSLIVFCQCNLALDRLALASRSRLSSQRESSVWADGSFRRKCSTGDGGDGRRVSAESAVARMPSYKNNFNQSQSGIEGVLMGALLGPLLDKLTASAHELSQPENMSYAQDIRLLLAYAFERHGNTLRRCALSALSAETLAEKVDVNGFGRKSLNGSGAGLNSCGGCGLLQSKSSSALISSSSPCASAAVAQPRDGAPPTSLRRGLFRRMQSTTTAASDFALGCADSDGGAAQPGGSTQSTPPPQLMPSVSVDDSIESPQGGPIVGLTGSKRAKTQQTAGRAGGGGGRLQFALSLLKGRSGTGSAEPTNSEEDDGGSSNAADDQQQFVEDVEGGGSLGGISVDAVSGAGGVRLRPEKSLSKRGEAFAESGGRRTGRGGTALKIASGAAVDDPLEVAHQHQAVPKFLPQPRLVQFKEVHAGAARFAFLLENSRPGTFPDSPLVAAIPELRSPVLARAVLLVECAHFVHRCNRADWPDWIRSGIFFSGQHRSFGGGSVGTCPTVPPTPSINPQSSLRVGAGGGGVSRRTALLQRASGRAFYAWGVQLGLRLQKQLDDEAEKVKKRAKMTPTTAEQRQLRLQDELEDFLDDGSVNDPRGSGDAMPVVLQLIVCALLQQITAFLRETFQSLPRAVRSQKQKSANAANSGWERLQSQRRWSILSNTFNPQTQPLSQQQPLGSGSMHSINELHPERRVSYSTADEENSPRGSHDMGETELAQSLVGSHIEKGKADNFWRHYNSPM
uniref:Protein UNC80 central region domain-containing protein n=1 Tax=Globodera rostochiensis TaxID=31243 RepID=A0A914HI14_GLORO